MQKIVIKDYFTFLFSKVIVEDYARFLFFMVQSLLLDHIYHIAN